MRQLVDKRQQGYTDEENPYWISFSDIMSGLLVIFVLAALALILELTQTRAEVTDVIKKIAQSEIARRDILNEIKDELNASGIDVEISENHTVLRIPEQVLTFAEDKYTLPVDVSTRNTVLMIGKVIHKSIVKGDRWLYLDTIFVEGHTDILRSKRKMGNWGLSTFRAVSVWDYWLEKLPEDVQLSTLVNHSDQPLFSVSGYGETRPIQIEQATRLQRKKNRRIDIRFTIKKPIREDFERLLDQLGGEL